MTIRHFAHAPAAAVVVALALGPGCTPADRQAPTPARTLPTSEGFVSMPDGTRLFHRTVGDGPRHVFLPGDLFLHPAFDVLAEGRTLHYYDMRNRGRSDSVSADRANSIEQDVADLEALRAHLGVEKADLVGFSYLGLMVVLYAMEHPERVDRIVQVGPVPMQFGTTYPAGLGPEDWFAALDSAAAADLRRLQAEGWAASHPQEYCEREQAVTRVTLVGDPANVTRLNQGVCAFPNEWPVRLEAHFSRHFTSVQRLAIDRARVAGVANPVLTVHGTKDRNAAYGAGREWAMTLPGARLVTVEGAAHCAWADAPEVVFASIDTFLAGGWPAAAEKVTTLERTATAAPGTAP